jgi:hypothetical protein
VDDTLERRWGKRIAAREHENARRIRPVRVALQNQRDDLLAFAGVLDAKLADVARALAVSEPLLREALMLHRVPTTSPAYWQGWNRLRAQLGGKFHTLFAAVSRAIAGGDPPGGTRPQSGLKGGHPAQQLARREPQLAAAHLLHPAPAPRRRVPRPAAVLRQPPPLPAQPPRRAPGQEPARADDRARPSALADPARLGRASAPTSVTRRG